jgi:hypothetical protein
MMTIEITMIIILYYNIKRNGITAIIGGDSIGGTEKHSSRC